ncbi:unnamed protein product [Cylindrotheca closterium]|uniref:Uncharacterized protein n=1 Tax=Cylindrotheca closterium TaxID=2856 RepID=A0AAD2CIJ2_9STRA|nr:unnamed protein product [Cylindrotheca closterium]
MQLKKQRSLRGLRSIQPFSINNKGSKSLRGMRSFGRKTTTTTNPEDPTTATYYTEGSSSSNSSVGSLEFNLDSMNDKREPPTSSTGAKEVKASLNNDNQWAIFPPSPTVGRESMKSKTAPSMKLSKDSIGQQKPPVAEVSLESKKAQTYSPTSTQTVKSSTTNKIDQQKPRPSAMERSQKNNEIKSSEPKSSSTIVHRENQKRTQASQVKTPTPKVIRESRRDKNRWGQEAMSSTKKDSKPANSTRSRPAAVLATGAVVSLQTNDERASSGDRIRMAVEKYYSKLEAVKQKQEEERDYLFDDALSASEDDYTDAGYTVFSDMTGNTDGYTVFSDTATGHSRMVDIDDIIEDDEFKRATFGDDMASVDSMATGISGGEQWGTGLFDCVLLRYNVTMRPSFTALSLWKHNSVEWSPKLTAVQAHLRANTRYVLPDLPHVLTSEEREDFMLQVSPPNRVVTIATCHHTPSSLKEFSLKADTILLVGGNDKSDKTLSTSDAAILLKEQNEDISLWGVTNPNDPYSFESVNKKIDAGMEGFITQPLLSTPALDIFESYPRDADTRYVAGLAMPRSAKNLQFWLKLLDQPELEQDALFKAHLAFFSQPYFTSMAWLGRELENLSTRATLDGVHLMPMGNTEDLINVSRFI